MPLGREPLNEITLGRPPLQPPRRFTMSVSPPPVDPPPALGELILEDDFDYTSQSELEAAGWAHPAGSGYAARFTDPGVIRLHNPSTNAEYGEIDFTLPGTGDEFETTITLAPAAGTGTTERLSWEFGGDEGFVIQIVLNSTNKTLGIVGDGVMFRRFDTSTLTNTSVIKATYSHGVVTVFVDGSQVDDPWDSRDEAMEWNNVNSWPESDFTFVRLTEQRLGCSRVEIRLAA